MIWQSNINSFFFSFWVLQNPLVLKEKTFRPLSTIDSFISQIFTKLLTWTRHLQHIVKQSNYFSVFGDECIASHLSSNAVYYLLANTIYLILYFQGQHKHSPLPTQITQQFPTLGGNCRSEHIQNAIEKCCPGKTMFIIMVSPLPGEYNKFNS